MKLVMLVLLLAVGCTEPEMATPEQAREVVPCAPNLDGLMTCHLACADFPPANVDSPQCSTDLQVDGRPVECPLTIVWMGIRGCCRKAFPPPPDVVFAICR